MAFPAFQCLTLSYPTVPNPILPLTLPYPGLTCPTLPLPTVLYPALPIPGKIWGRISETVKGQSNTNTKILGHSWELYPL